MAKLTKKRKIALSKYDQAKAYPIADAAKILKEILSAKFDPSIERALGLVLM